MPFRPVDPKVAFPDLERSLRDWWAEAGIVARAMASGDPSRPFVFFEGPPTANGRPGIHHVEARAVKDIIVRFNRMRGRRIIGDRGGWDTHGLPVEIQVERELGFGGKPDIEKYGIAEFNRACKESVWRYIKEWEDLTHEIAYWIDLDVPYVTYHNDYIESLWWILKRLWESDLLQPAAGLDLIGVLTTYGPTVQSETLAVSLDVQPPEPADRVVTAELEEGGITIGVQRAEP